MSEYFTIPSDPEVPEDYASIEQWRLALPPAVATLRMLAGATEDEFLQIGSRLQDFYLRSSDITTMANQLVETVSGEQMTCLVQRLQQVRTDMERYLESARANSRESSTTLERILKEMENVAQPLEGFQKMYKMLRMLGISTKIESSRMGDAGAAFMTLALDVERLSHQVNDKSASILVHSQQLSGMIAGNLRMVRSSEAAQDTELSGVLAATSGNIEAMLAVNDRCGNFGALVSNVSSLVTENISEVVSSMQMHDMTRQQVEHVIEALERLHGKLPAEASMDMNSFRQLVIEAGDVCELQSAQLRHAASELTGAVRVIIDNLRDVAGKQETMATESGSVTGSSDAGGSFVEAMSNGMSKVTAVLARCAQADREMSETLQRVATTMGEIKGFITDIEDIGLEINLIALNSQIKAAHTGSEGAGLGVLAEAIKRLAVDAVTQTEVVSSTLLEVNSITEGLFAHASLETEDLIAHIAAMESEVNAVLGALGTLNNNLLEILSGLAERVGMLSNDIETATGSIDVHDRVERMASDVMGVLEVIVQKARHLVPASNEFKDNLRHMEARYTMESERHIHEAIARKRGATITPVAVAQKQPAAAESESGFGDNVDLF